ncbi:MAG: MarR family transcriptional regulator [Pseudomonadota bacterium]
MASRGIYIATVDKTTNLLGAVAIALNDRIRSGLDEVLHRKGESAAALVVVGYAPGLAVETLRQVLGRSHPGTVRLIDRLEDDGLVERRKGEDGRAVALHLTLKGSRLRKKLLSRRLDVLEAGLKGLSAQDRQHLGNLLEKVLANLPETEMAKHRICRLCEVRLCRQCPIRGNAV